MADCLTSIAAIGLHVASWHADPGFNNFNPGGFVRSECEVFYGQPQVGTFYNSEEAVSFYVGMEFEYDRAAMVTPFLLVGAATGYPRASVVPIASVGVRFRPFSDDFPIAFAIGYSPGIGNPCKERQTASNDPCRRPSDVLHLAVEWRF